VDGPVRSSRARPCSRTRHGPGPDRPAAWGDRRPAPLARRTRAHARARRGPAPEAAAYAEAAVGPPPTSRRPHDRNRHGRDREPALTPHSADGFGGRNGSLPLDGGTLRPDLRDEGAARDRRGPVRHHHRPGVSRRRLRCACRPRQSRGDRRHRLGVRAAEQRATDDPRAGVPHGHVPPAASRRPLRDRQPGPGARPASRDRLGNRNGRCRRPAQLRRLGLALRLGADIGRRHSGAADLRLVRRDPTRARGHRVPAL
jgi:hypothetical protein